MRILKSNWLIGISVTLFILVAVSGIMIALFTGSIKDDANVINSAGIIRGMIQRIAKLETNDIRSDALIAETDNLIDDFIAKKIYFVTQDNDFNDKLKDIRASWEKMKIEVMAYRSSTSSSDKQSIIRESEIVWSHTFIAVKTAQRISERKVSYYRVLFGFGAVILCILGFMIHSLKVYVKDKLEYLTAHDVLTGAYNRMFFNEFLNRMLRDSERSGMRLCLIMLDIDFFKRVNDTYGHNRGDYVLKEVVRLICSIIRQKDVFARIGGEEFSIILTDTDLKGAVSTAEKIRLMIKEYCFEGIGQITISLGVTAYEAGDSIETIFKKADEALYAAKNNGRNRVHLKIGNEVYYSEDYTYDE
ncbi:MAG: GGDEF domain-containing protein [Bacillota bacterium]